MTNNLPYAEIIQHIPGNGKFLYSPFSIFDNQSIIEFFESRGVALKEEDHGRMFPVSNQSQDVLDALIRELKQNKVTVKEEQTVVDVKKWIQTISKSNFKMVIRIKQKQSLLRLVAQVYPKLGQQAMAIALHNH